MHGLIHTYLKKFVEDNHSSDVWKAIISQAGLESKTYLPISNYPDEDVNKILASACELTGNSMESIQEEFGFYISPTLIDMYPFLIKKEWRTLDLLLNTEEIIHKLVRQKNPGADPPKLEFEKIDDHTLKFNYTSQRKMSAVSKGIMKGVAKHYGETLTIQENKNPDGTSTMKILIS